jgi:GAF domain-containing protein
MEKNRKVARYERIYDQLNELLVKTSDTTARMSTINAVLHHKMDGFFWTGFYLLKEDELIVGPYQGPVACQILVKNQGVCWAAVRKNETIIVQDVEKFPGHIACDSRSKSEIALPVHDANGNIVAVMDVDSRELNNFDETDGAQLSRIAELAVVKK